MLLPRTHRKLSFLDCAFVFYVFFTVISTVSAADVDVDDFKIWRKTFTDDFEKIRTDLLDGFKPKEDSYRTKTYDDVQAKKELDNIVGEMEVLTNKKKLILTNMRYRTEKLYEDYPTPTDNITCKSFGYNRAKNLTKQPIPPEEMNSDEKCKLASYVPMKPSPLMYNMSVSWDNATAHVPTNVYDGSNAILLTASWTGGMDKQFKEQQNKKGEEQKWQYFCSSRGLFRMYPGVRWKIQIDAIGEDQPVDFFDCRSQPWYIEGAASPKEILILVDKSGSMKGRRETIANLTVSEILDTLTENDFFNVILFNESIHYADPRSADVLLQATRRNKKRIMEVMNVVPSGIAEYAKGLEAAFDLLNKSEEGRANESTAMNQAIMIISDGAPDYFPDLFNRRNPNKTVRVFTYMIGQQASDRDKVQKMACNNRGFFVQIATLADVKENVQTYLPVMARTNALHRERFTVWTGVHDEQMKADRNLDLSPPENTTTTTTTTTTPAPTTASPNATNNTAVPPTPAPKIKKKNPPVEPINFFTSVSQAVYNLKNETDMLLGVIGMDIPIQSFKNFVPFWKYGVHGYFFAINNNGYILFHPNFRPTYKNNLKPFYQNVDLAEVEMSVNMNLMHNSPDYNMTLRVNMIEREEGNTTLEVFNIPDGFKSAYSKTMKYFYKPLKDTPFSIGLALHWDKKESHPILDMPNMGKFKTDCKSSLTNKTGYDCVANSPSAEGLKLIPYPFCQKFDFQEKIIFDSNPVCAFMDVLSNSTKESAMECSSKFIDGVCRDAKHSKDLISNWKKAWKREILKKLGIDQVFTLFYSGLIRFYNDSTPFEPEFINQHLKGSKDTLFETTLDSTEHYNTGAQPVYHLYFDIPSAVDVQRKLVDRGNFTLSATSIVYVDEKKPAVPVAVTGVQLIYSKLKEYFLQTANTSNKENCNSPHVDCYLVSSNGYVILSARSDEDLARPLAEVDCRIMEALINESLFESLQIYDFQAICVYPLSGKSFANRLIDPITKLIGTISWLTFHISMFLMEFFTTTLWSLLASAQEYLTLNIMTSQQDDDDLSLNQSTANVHQDDPVIIRQTEARVHECRNKTTEEDVIKCFQEYLNSLCRRISGQSGNECITACKALRKFSPDHWNAHEKCIYPTKPCSKEHTVYRVRVKDNQPQEPMKGDFTCKRCPNKRKWMASGIKNTNLLLVVAWPARTSCGSCSCTLDYRSSVEIKMTYNSTIEPPYRKAPEWMKNVNPELNATDRKENDSHCSNRAQRQVDPSSFTLLAVVFVGLLGFPQNR